MSGEMSWGPADGSAAATPASSQNRLCGTSWALMPRIFTSISGFSVPCDARPAAVIAASTPQPLPPAPIPSFLAEGGLLRRDRDRGPLVPARQCEDVPRAQLCALAMRPGSHAVAAAARGPWPCPGPSNSPGSCWGWCARNRWQDVEHEYSVAAMNGQRLPARTRTKMTKLRILSSSGTAGHGAGELLDHLGGRARELAGSDGGLLMYDALRNRTREAGRKARATAHSDRHPCAGTSPGSWWTHLIDGGLEARPST